MIRFASFLAVFVPISTWAVDAQLSAVEYIGKMGQALQTLNYHGSLVYINDGRVESMQLIHKNDGQGEFERLVHLSGEPREVIRNKDVVTCYLPDSQSVLVGQRRFNNHLFAKLTANLEQFAPNYSFIKAGSNRVAGRNTHIIEINPKDLYRYGYRLWLEETSNLLLKSELVNSQGEVLEQMMFTQIDIVDHIPEAMLKPAVSGESFTWHGEGENGANDLDVDWAWQVVNLPSGFMISARYKQQMPNSSQPAEHVIISDGLASVSVYIEPFNAESQSFVGASRMGAVNIFGSVHEDHQVTVVGEVPMPTVEMIAQSIRYSPEASTEQKAGQ
ncbi:MucB/RseB C-terminal domain-containing protein [Kaarinaea lacus]